MWAGGRRRRFYDDYRPEDIGLPDRLQHFFVGGVGLRQICDWCRLLWTYRERIDRDLLLRRLQEMWIVSEWKAFGAFAVEYLGLPLSVYRLLLLDESDDSMGSSQVNYFLELVFEWRSWRSFGKRLN